MPTWWLISDDDTRAIKLALESAIKSAEDECNRSACFCDMDGGARCGDEHRAALHTLDSGLHTTDAVPADERG